MLYQGGVDVFASQCVWTLTSSQKWNSECKGNSEKVEIRRQRHLAIQTGKPHIKMHAGFSSSWTAFSALLKFCPRSVVLSCVR
mmetsp:Transcript_63900/g.183566  ORF Transcript_63900/g.183566 Transcript_63900/m.183566 type:complete len:83 (-) Transcript_63900:545-793(-)